MEAAETQDDPDEDAVDDLLDAQPSGTGAALSLPVPAGAYARVPTWHSRRYWLTLCEWIVTHTERGRAALTRHGIAAQTFLRVCAAHAHYAESATGRHVCAALATLATKEELSIDQLKRGRRALKTLDLGVELARGKKLNATEREAAARLHSHVHGQLPARPQIGAASVWALSAPAWAVEAMPAPEKPRKGPRRRRRRQPRFIPRTGISATQDVSSGPHRSPSSAPQSSSGSLSVCLSVRKDHQARTRAGEQHSTSTTSRPLALQRAAAQLVERIPALRTIVGIDDTTGRRRGHIGSICDLLVDAGIDTDRWTGIDIAQTLNHDTASRGWTWPTAEAIANPLRLVTYRLSLLTWANPSPTECKLHDRKQEGETAAEAAYRMAMAHRRDRAARSVPLGPPASDGHRRTVREQLTTDLAAKKKVAARCAR
ncbi:Rep protein [Rhodococcus rhodochrous]|uniref:Rep protein n=2 Tax=Rhodococcus rhodochrous TaxID=1829 RepID=A0AAW4XQ78_RHORH|nr:Rep protein [Rhodococcus rhodochrous]